MPELNKYGLLGKNNNQMTMLCNTIERQLGTSMLPLPDNIKKDTWPQIIMEDTIPQFSEFYPYGMTIVVEPHIVKDGFVFIDQTVPEGTRILGYRDIDWVAYRSDSRFDRYGINLDAQTWMTRQYALDDIALSAVGADMISLFDLGIFIEYTPPNKIRLVSVNGNPVSQFRPFPLVLLVEHPGLWTISPTMMTQFRNLAKSDVATAIYETMKFFDNLDTVYGSLQLQMDTIQDWKSRRDDIVRELKEAAVSTANEYQPIMMTV